MMIISNIRYMIPDLGTCSDLLEDDEELFEVLPGGVINAPLAVALRMLTASNEQFATWSTLEGECHAIH